MGYNKIESSKNLVSQLVSSVTSLVLHNTCNLKLIIQLNTIIFFTGLQCLLLKLV